jgi:ATP-binding cassette subfamily B protein
MNDDVNQLERFLDVGANQLIQVATTVLVVGGIFFAAEWRLALIAFLPVPFVLWGSIRFQARIAPRYMVVRERVADLSARLTNSLGGIATIKSFTAEERESASLERASEAYRQANRDAIRSFP